VTRQELLELLFGIAFATACLLVAYGPSLGLWPW
jgi:hypothetical protein